MDADLLDLQLGKSLKHAQANFRASLETYVGRLPQRYQEDEEAARFILAPALARGAIAFARSRGSTRVEETDLMAAQKQSAQAFAALLERPEVRIEIAKVLAQLDRTDEYVLLVRVLTQEPGANTQAIWEHVRKELRADGSPVFRSAGHLMEWLNRGRDQGWWVMALGRYRLP